jgi:hypothetical protein
VNVRNVPVRLEVTVKAGARRAGHWVKQAAKPGTVAFSVGLDAKTRRTLEAKRRLRLTVTVAVSNQASKRVKVTVSL